MMNLLFLSLCSLLLMSVSAFELYSLTDKKVVEVKSVYSAIDSDAIILMGETHYLKDSIKTQSDLIKNISRSVINDGTVVSWEFLNYSEQIKISTLYDRFVRDQVTLQDMLTEFFPLGENGQNPNHAYKDLFVVAKSIGANFLGTNAPRAWKRVVVRDGVEALPPQQVPSNMRRGSSEYFERFFAAVGGHGDPSAIEGYFMAQSYADAFMANSIVSDSEGKLTFMTVGYFHNDYGHGLPSYIKDISNRQIVNLRLVDKSELSWQQIEDLKDESVYGKISDYIVFY